MNKESPMDKYTSSLEGRHIVIWGGTGGIGQAIAKMLAYRGAKAISFTGRKLDAAEALAKELEELGAKSFFRNVDRLDPNDHDRFLEEAEEKMGIAITGVVDTVGISPNTPHLEQTVEEWQKVMNINVIGSFIATRASAEHILKQGNRGEIVLITSSNGVNSQASYSVHYDSSKIAQAHMMRTIAEPYMKQGIRINAVAPGWVRTTEDMLPPDQSEIDKEMAKIWIGRFADPEEIAAEVAHLLSPASGFTVGMNKLVDGGYR